MKIFLFSADNILAEIKNAEIEHDIVKIHELLLKAKNENLIDKDIELNQKFLSFLIKLGRFERLIELDKKNYAEHEKCIKIRDGDNIDDLKKLCKKSPYNLKIGLKLLKYYFSHKNFFAISELLRNLKPLHNKNLNFNKFEILFKICRFEFQKIKNELIKFGEKDFAEKYERFYTRCLRYQSNMKDDYIEGFKNLIASLEKNLQTELFEFKIYEGLYVFALEGIIKYGPKKIKEYKKYLECLIERSPNNEFKLLLIQFLVNSKRFEEAKKRAEDFKITDKKVRETIDRLIKTREEEEKKEKEIRERKNRTVKDIYNYYSMLDLKPSALDSEVALQYKKFVKKFSELARTKNREKEGNEKLQKINEAYEVLKDKKKREQYDNNAYRKEEKSHMPDRQGGHKHKYYAHNDVDDFEEVIAQFFGGGFSRRGRTRQVPTQYYTRRTYRYDF